MITQDIIRKLWDQAGYGNIAIWENDSMTVVPVDYSGETAGKKPLVILKPVALVNRFKLLDFALSDGELLTFIEETIRAAGGQGPGVHGHKPWSWPSTHCERVPIRLKASSIGRPMPERRALQKNLHRSLSLGLPFPSRERR